MLEFTLGRLTFFKGLKRKQMSFQISQEKCLEKFDVFICSGKNNYRG